jgi:hypothetical protein
MKINLEDKDWSEIESALVSKINALERGEYGDGDLKLDIEEWADHLKSIRSRLTKQLDEKGATY